MEGYGGPQRASESIESVELCGALRSIVELWQGASAGYVTWRWAVAVFTA